MKPHTIIRDTIDELDKAAFVNQEKYDQKTKYFLEDRYAKIIGLLPTVKEDAIGLEVGLLGGVFATSIKRALHLQRLYTLEHPVTSKLYTKQFHNFLKKENIINKPVDLHSQPLPWPDNYFDFIVFSEVAEHLIPADLPNVLAEFRRVLKNSGWLMITTPNISSLLKRINLLRGKNPVEFDTTIHEQATYGHIREYTLNELLQLTENVRLKIAKSGYYVIDRRRNMFTQIEYFSHLLYPQLGNNLYILANKTRAKNI